MKASVFRLTLCLWGLLPSLVTNADTWDNHQETLDTEGRGTLLQPIVVSTPGQLAGLSHMVNNGNSLEGKIIVLGSNIDLTATDGDERRGWVPIGTEANPFKGVFLGTNPITEGWERQEPYTIKGLYINSNSKYCGLFGVSQGFVGYLNIVGAEIQSSAYTANCGIVCGKNDTSAPISCLEDNSKQHTFTVPGAIYAVRAEGVVTTTGTFAQPGGIVSNNNGHVVHSTAKVTIHSNGSVGTMGGIAAVTSHGVIFDCAADVDLFTPQSAVAVGGITGILHSGMVEASASTGFIHDRALYAGGISGDMEAESYIRGCVSTATIDTWGGAMAGIAGSMLPSSGNAQARPKIECCVFAGHLKGDTNPVGGICGTIELANKEERIVNTLVTGTHILKENYNTTVGSSKAEPVQALSNSYWDKSFYAGTTISGYAGDLEAPVMPVTVRGLTTDKLTSGKSADTNLLIYDPQADFYFKLQQGYYPRLIAKKEWSGYETLKANNLSTEAGRKLFGYDEVYRENSVMMPFAWFAAVPATMPKGDTAYDLVTSVSHMEKTISWNENQRSVSLKTDIIFPENSPVIDLDDHVAKVIADGTFMAAMTLAPADKPGALFCRPQPLMPSRQLFFNATPDQLWDGTTATAFADGTGQAEDPYIVKNGAQLALAVLSNAEGQWFKQLCDINLNTDYPENIPQVANNQNIWVMPQTGWKGIYNGDGHYVIRPVLSRPSNNLSLFGNVAETGQIYSLGVVGAFFSTAGSAVLANNVDGRVYNCIVQGVCLPAGKSTSWGDGAYDLNGSGGLCTTVGLNNAGAVVEDCISAVFCEKIFSDFNPLVCLTDKNKGVVRNCLVATPVLYGDLNFQDDGITAEGKSYIKDCYWLRGQEPGDTGHTLEEIIAKLGSRERWKASEDYYYPMLKTFAESDMGKLLMLPVRTDLSETDYANFQLGIDHHLLFEPGGAVWERGIAGNSYFDTDTDMGIIAPVITSISPEHYSNNSIRNITLMHFLTARLGKFVNNIPLRTSSSFVSPGITFVDDNAKQACIEAFNADTDNEHLSLAELKAVTTEQTLTAFQTATARQIKRFPEFRLFKSVTKLTTQLNNMTGLEEVRLPFALSTIGSNAFSGCSSLREVTIPSKVTDVEPHPFYGSAVEEVSVDAFNTVYTSRDGVLFTENNALVAYPDGRQDEEEITISGDVASIEEGAFYRLPKLKRLFFDIDDYKRIIPELQEGGIETADGRLIDIYVKDASFDQQVYSDMLDDYSWEEYAETGRLHRYYPLKIDKDGLGSFYIGFDTELPAALTPFIVPRSRPDLKLAFLQPVSRQVPAASPVVVFANYTKPGSSTHYGESSSQATIYNLLPSTEPLAPWKMYENRLNGAGINGLPVYQEDSSEGGVYTLQKADNGTTGFFIHREERVAPFHAYLPYNSIGDHLDQGIYFELAFGVTEPNNLTYWVCPDGQAILAGYQGQGNEHLVVPETISGEASPNPSEGRASPDPSKGGGSGSLLPSFGGVGGGLVTQIDEAFLLNNKADIWSIDFTQNSLIKGFKVDRSDPENPFFGTDKRTIVYLPGGQGFTVADDEQNVVIGTECKHLSLTDGWGFEPPYDFTTEKAAFDRVLSATQNTDGTWMPKAFSVCMPYDIIFDKEQMLARGLAVYELWDIHQNTGSFVFTNSMPNMLLRGHAYVVVVNNGSVTLSVDAKDNEYYDNSILVKAHPSEEQPVWIGYPDANGDVTVEIIGKWMGTFMPMSNAECSERQVYIIQSDGYYRRVSNATAAHRRVNLCPFRAFFQPEQPLSRNGYKMLFQYHEEGDEIESKLGDFPTTIFESDGDMQPYDDEMAVGIREIYDLPTYDSRFKYGDYYDLQGRRLQRKPTKGMYIYKGQKRR